MATAGGNLGRTAALDERDGHIAQGRYHLGCRAGADAGAVFSEGHVSDIVQTILNTPMASHQFEQAEWAGCGGRETGNHVDDLVPRVALGRDSVRELADLGQCRPMRGEIGGEFGADFEAAHFGTASVPIPGLCLSVVGIRISKIRDQIRQHARLILLHQQDRVSVLLLKQTHELHLGMERIRCTDTPGKGQRR